VVSKTKKLVSGSVLGGISFILRIFLSLFMTPFMISSFGDHVYGLWMLFASFGGFYGILDLGLSTAVQRFMARAVGVDDKEEINNIFNTSLVVFCGIGIVSIIFAGLLIWFSPFFVKDAADVYLFRLIIVFCSVNIVIGFPMRSFWGILSSNLRYDISIYLDMINVIIKTVLIVFFLKKGFGVVAVSVINLLTDLAWNAANIMYAFKVAPYIKISMSYIKKDKFKMFFSYSVYVFISRVADTIKFNIDNYVISAFIGLSSVTVYSIGTRLIGYALDLLGKLVGLMTPVFSQFEGQGDFDSIKEKFFFIFKLSTYVSIFLGMLLFVLAQPFISRWVGAGYEDSVVVILIFLIPTIFRMIMSTSDQLLYGISKHKFLTWINCSEALANLILSLIFVRHWGIYGVALGTAIPMVLVKVVIQPVYTAKVLGISCWKLYSIMLLAISKSLLVLFSLYLITKQIIASSFLRLIYYSAIQTVMYALIMFKFGLSTLEQEQVARGFIPRWVRGNNNDAKR